MIKLRQKYRYTFYFFKKITMRLFQIKRPTVILLPASKRGAWSKGYIVLSNLPFS